VVVCSPIGGPAPVKLVCGGTTKWGMNTETRGGGSSNNLAFASVRFLEESTKQAISANRTSSIAYLHLYRYRHPQSALTVKVRLLRPTPKYMAADPQRLATGADMWISTSTGFLLGQIWPPTLVRASEENKQSAML
jgi:hypothetical protein